MASAIRWGARGVLALMFVACSGGGGGTQGAHEAISAELHLDSCIFERLCEGGIGAGACIDGLFRDDFFEASLSPGAATVVAAAPCLAAARTCAAYRACMSAPVVPCDAPGARCDGNVAVWCSETRGETRLDCAVYDARCETRLAESQGVGCVLDAPVTRCSDSVTHVAFEERGSDGDIFWVLHCDALGFVCDDESGCVSPERSACSESRCDGPYVRECNDGLVARYDCRSAHPAARCFLEDDAQPRCGLPPEARECTEGSRCEGTTLVRCTYGIEVSVDCARYGAECRANPSGSDDAFDCAIDLPQP